MANVAKGHDLNKWTRGHVAGYQPRSVNGRGSAPTAPVWASRLTRRFSASRCSQSRPEAAESADGFPLPGPRSGTKPGVLRPRLRPTGLPVGSLNSSMRTERAGQQNRCLRTLLHVRAIEWGHDYGA